MVSFLSRKLFLFFEGCWLLAGSDKKFNLWYGSASNFTKKTDVRGQLKIKKDAKIPRMRLSLCPMMN